MFEFCDLLIPMQLCSDHAAPASVSLPHAQRRARNTAESHIGL